MNTTDLLNFLLNDDEVSYGTDIKLPPICLAADVVYLRGERRYLPPKKTQSRLPLDVYDELQKDLDKLILGFPNQKSSKRFSRGLKKPISVDAKTAKSEVTMQNDERRPYDNKMKKTPKSKEITRTEESVKTAKSGRLPAKKRNKIKIRNERILGGAQEKKSNADSSVGTGKNETKSKKKKSRNDTTQLKNGKKALEDSPNREGGQANRKLKKSSAVNKENVIRQ